MVLAHHALDRSVLQRVTGKESDPYALTERRALPEWGLRHEVLMRRLPVDFRPLTAAGADRGRAHSEWAPLLEAEPTPGGCY